MKRDFSFGVIPLCKFAGEWNVFLVKMHQGHWGFPKGHAGTGETPLQSAERELFEETGLSLVKLLSNATIQETYHFQSDGQHIDKTVSYFLAEVTGNVALQVAEIAEGEWVPIAAAQLRVTFPQTKAICRQVCTHIRSL